ncbi:MAG: T9SS type A sorting domain-containing protein [Bacteroidia bacterium]
MKHIFYSACLITSVFGSQVLSAQSSERAKVPASLKTVSLKRAVHNHMGVNESPAMPLSTPNPTVQASGARAFGPETIVGQTYYDLQTNNSINYRLQNHGDGTLSASWTHSSVETVGWADRGMGYHHFDGSSWTKLPNYAQVDSITRVEDVRTGFGSIARVQGVGDIIVAHQTAINALQVSRNTSFTEENWIIDARTEMPLIWPRMKVGGPDGKTVHIIALTEPEGGTFTGTPFNGINGALLYNRSTDGGQSFDKLLVQLPNVDSSIFASFGGDSYALDARGNTVAFVAGSLTSRVEMWKSIDNGETWTSRTVLPFPYEPWSDQLTDFDGDGDSDSVLVNATVSAIDTTFDDITEYISEIDSMAVDSLYEYIFDENMIAIDSFYVYEYAYDTTIVDSITTTIIVSIDTTFTGGEFVLESVSVSDGTFDIVIDQNDKVHVWFGAMEMQNDDATDDQVSYFPFQEGIRYWNEDFELDSLPQYILFTVDDDQNGILDVEARFANNVVPYGTGLTSFPSAGLDDDGNLYVTYSATKEGVDYLNLGEGPSFRHIYISKSTDDGLTWSDPIDLVDDEDAGFDQFAEYSYCSVARLVDDKIHILYQRDYTPGSAVTIDDATTHPFDIPNDIIYMSVTKDFENVGINNTPNKVSDLALLPNPTNEATTLRFKLEEAADVTISVLNMLGQEVALISSQKAAPGVHNVNLGTSELPSGIYLVNVEAGAKRSTTKLIVRH